MQQFAPTAKFLLGHLHIHCQDVNYSPAPKSDMPVCMFVSEDVRLSFGLVLLLSFLIHCLPTERIKVQECIQNPEPVV